MTSFYSTTVELQDTIRTLEQRMAALEITLERRIAALEMIVCSQQAIAAAAAAARSADTRWAF